MDNENKKINHIAIAVPDIKEAALKWQQAFILENKYIKYTSAWEKINEMR